MIGPVGHLLGRLLLVLPLVLVVTVLALAERADSPHASPDPAPATTSRPTATTTVAAEPALGTTVPAPTTTPAPSVDPGLLPRSGSGTFTYASVAAEPVVAGPAPFVDYSVATEDGSRVDPDALAEFVDTTLADPRSWIGDGRTGLRRVAEGGTFTLVVATPDTVDRLCAPLQTNGIYSCGRNGWIALNLVRWETATEDWPADLTTYRHYLVNHEVGHYLRGPSHDSCPGSGQPAPIMMQQTKGLDGCLANGWVFPEASG